ncbi:hypothetical protein [Hasllibacter sp. MH4015]|uniref:hypothetical protein n=1 Tax=Hasllibacter sp. MH4015 TaxID=2854029 RepID=UPI001CD534AD|nr:hypothetical protein [Hasllibacter sp. MH4015]
MRLAALIFAVLAGSASAQTLGGLTLGELIPDTAPDPLGTHIVEPFAITIWALEDEIGLTASRDAETGEILYIEMWINAEVAHDTPIDGIRFGETTTEDIVARFGSGGFAYADRGRFVATDTILAHYLSYEIEGTDSVVIFVTHQPIETASADTVREGVLNTIMVGRASYMAATRGVDRNVPEGYRPIADPFPHQAE